MGCFQLHCRKALDKLIEWQAAAGQMKTHLAQGDEVLANWYKMLADFKQPLPILHKLSNDALKVSLIQILNILHRHMCKVVNIGEKLSYNLYYFLLH